MSTPVGAAAARLARLGHLPVALLDAGGVFAALAEGRAARLAADPPVDELLLAVLGRDGSAAAAAAGTPPHPAPALLMPRPAAGVGSPGRASVRVPRPAHQAPLARPVAPSPAWPAADAVPATRPATSAGDAPRGPHAAPNPARRGPAGAIPPAPPVAPVTQGSRLEISPAARKAAHLPVPPAPAVAAPAAHTSPAPAGRPRQPAPAAGAYDITADPAAGPAPASDVPGGPVAPAMPAGWPAPRPAGPAAPEPATPAGARRAAAAPPVPAPRGLAGLAEWWEAAATGPTSGDDDVAEPGGAGLQPVRPMSPRPADAGAGDDDPLLVLDRFTAALEQVLISEAASHGIEVRR